MVIVMRMVVMLTLCGHAHGGHVRQCGHAHGHASGHGGHGHGGHGHHEEEACLV